MNLIETEIGIDDPVLDGPIEDSSNAMLHNLFGTPCNAVMPSSYELKSLDYMDI